jgi:hypothetical protein
LPAPFLPAIGGADHLEIPVEKHGEKPVDAGRAARWLQDIEDFGRSATK